MAGRQGTATELPLTGAVTEAVTPPPGDFWLNPQRRFLFWLRAALLAGRRSITDMLPPHALHAAKISNRKCQAISGTGH